MTAAVNPPIKQPHEQETITAADKHHGAGPYVFDDRVYEVPSPTQSHHCCANAKENTKFDALFQRTLQSLSCQYT